MDHIDIARLRQVATEVGSVFDASEESHLRGCALCLDRFAQIVFEKLGWNDGPPFVKGMVHKVSSVG